MAALARVVNQTDRHGITGETVWPIVNDRNMARILDDKDLKVRFDLFPEEDHFSGLPSQFGRAIPFALSK